LFEKLIDANEEDGLIEYMHPMALQIKAGAQDNFRYHEAMNGPYAEEFWTASEEELETLEVKRESWDIVDRTDEMNVLKSTWAMKIKRFPNGLIKKFKARFCVRGDMQIEGVDFFDTYAPVVQWSTIRLIMIIALLLNLANAQADVTAAFLHAPLDEGEEIFVDMPMGFKQPGKVYKLKKSQYGLRQSPKNFFNYLKERLETVGCKQSMFDPCLFISDKVLVVTWVDDLLIYSPNDDWINELLEELNNVDLEIVREGDTAGFLGVDIQRDAKTGTVEMCQTGLIDRIVQALGLEDAECGKVQTPAEYGALAKFPDGESCTETFNYGSVVGMLLYLAGHSRPDIAFAVHQCARYTFCPKAPHEKALKRIGRYLKNTRTRGLVLKPSKQLKIDCYPDADFAGLWGYEDPQDPNSAKSRTGFVITVADCPIVWHSKMQTEIALSTMEAEYVALNASCKDLIPIIRIVKGLAKVVGLPMNEVSKMHVSVHEDNAGALVLARMEPPRMTPRSKHYCTKYHWFRYQLKPHAVELFKIATENQLGDIFTKGLRVGTFQNLRKMLMGW
jgi:hypothetical protein